MGVQANQEGDHCRGSQLWKVSYSGDVSLTQCSNYRPTGMRRIVADYVIVKPKIERLQLQHGVTPDDLKDFVGPRNFLTKYKGVK